MAGYDAAIKKTMQSIIKGLQSLPTTATEQEVIDNILYNIYKDWGKNFTKKQRKSIETWISKSYKHYRVDKAVFGKYKGPIPDAVFEVRDYRTMAATANMDSYYLGKFITDPDTKARFTEFIKKKYLEEQLPIWQKDKEFLAAFRTEFTDLFHLEDYKIRRIINTTVNKMRNYASVEYINQAGIERFVIRGVNDQLQCKYCSYMQGKSFSVTKTIEKIAKIDLVSEDSVKDHSPFITSVYKKPEDMKDLTGDQLQASGIDSPPFHGHCRDRLVADI